MLRVIKANWNGGVGKELWPDPCGSETEVIFIVVIDGKVNVMLWQRACVICVKVNSKNVE